MMEWNTSEDGMERLGSRNLGFFCGVFPRFISATETDPESLGAAQRLGNKEGVEPRQAAVASLTQRGSGLGAGRTESGRQTVGRVQCVHVFAD